MTARAESTAATRARIVDAALALLLARPYDEVTLRAVAEAAGVSLPTVVRVFGSKAGMVEAVLEVEQPALERRRAVPPGDSRRAAAAIVEDYERTGDGVLRALAVEGRFAELDVALASGRDSHRAWAARTFAPALRGLHGRARARRVALFAAATDVYTWKLLRRDYGLGVDATITAIAELLEALEAQR
jgi:AcrR family transcriptional regulator